VATGSAGRQHRPGRSLVLTLALVAAGAAGILYGVLFHTQTVLPKPAEPEPEAAAPEDPPAVLPEEDMPAFSPEELFGAPSEDDEPFTLDIEPGTGPALEAEPVANEPFVETEPEMVREVTIGGLERLETGELARTYDAEKGVPSFCPT
jgi:hypothetical protein